MELMERDIAVPTGYKETEFGPVPGDWMYTTFEEVLTGFSSGMTPYRGRPEYYKGKINWITSGELNYNLIVDTKEKITQKAVDDTNLKFLPEGTFLMAITGLEAAGTRGSCGIVGKKATTNQSCMALFPTEKMIIEYLFHFYVRFGNELAFKYCQGTKQQSYTGKIVKILPIVLPPTLQEQRAIATALSDVDALIRSLGDLIDKKRAVKQGAMQELLTGKRRLAGFEGEKRYKKTEAGIIPDDWKSTTVGTQIEFSGGSQPPRNTFLFSPKEGYVRLLQIRDYKTDKYKTYIPIELAQKKCNTDDVMIGRYGPPIFQILRGLEGAYNVALIKAIPKSTIDKEFMYYFLTQEKLFKFVENLSQRSSGQTGVDLVQLKNYSFPIPSSLEEQLAIAQALSDMDAEITTLEAKQTKYQQIKQGMMQELLTGKTRLV